MDTLGHHIGFKGIYIFGSNYVFHIFFNEEVFLKFQINHTKDVNRLDINIIKLAGMP